MFKVSPQQLKAIIYASNEQHDVQTLGDLGVAKNIIQQIRTNLDHGLKEDELQQRRNHFGSNSRLDLEKMSFCQALCISFFKFSWLFCMLLSSFAFLLRCASTNWKYSNYWIESIVISSLIWSNMIISIFQLKNNDNIEKAKLQIKEQKKQVTVLRKGEKKQIIAGDLVVGDVVILEEGVYLYADGLVVEAEGLYLNESFITASQEYIQKSQIEPKGTEPINLRENIVLGSSMVVSGNGKYVVLAVGQHTIHNQIQVVVQEDIEKEGYLQTQTIELQKKIQTFGFLGSFLVIFLLIGRYLITYNDVNAFTTFSNILNLIVVLLSANASEALSIHFTVQLSQTVSNMLKNNNLVRNFKCLELLPFMNRLIVEKTGVLTQNTMALEQFWNENSFELNQLKFNSFPQDLQKALIQCCYVNNALYNKIETNSLVEKETYKILSEIGVKSEDKVTIFIPNTPKRKQVATILNNNRIVVRGASELIFNSCSHFHSLLQGVVEIDQIEKEHLTQQMEQLVSQGRTLAIAYRDIDMSQMNIQKMIDEDKFDLNKKNLTLVGFLLFNDPIKQTAQQAVALLQSAGIKVIIATGDNSITAKSVAIKCLIFDTLSKIIEGPDFARECSDRNTEFLSELEQISVVSRSRPEDKQTLVQYLKKNGNVVGCCGSGNYDVPALHDSDIGFSFGISGTEIVKATSDIILLDDNLSSIVQTVLYGRNLLDSVKKFGQYQISCHFPLIIILIASSAVGDAVISPLQFIWVNVITDLFATFALSNPTPSNMLLQRKPHRPNEQLLDKLLLIHIGILSTYQIIVGIVFVKKSLMVFNTFVLVTLFNLINSRMISFEINVFKGFFSSWMIFASLFGIALLQYIIIQFGGTIMSTYDGLTLQEWGVCIGFGIGGLIWRMLMVLIIRPILVNCQIYLLE